MAEDNQFGYGQQHPSDSASEYNVTKFIIDQAMAGMSTMKAVKVMAVTDDTVDVTPLVKLKDGSGNVTDQGTVFGIPVMKLQWGKNAVVGKPAVGDIGMLICSDRDISAVKSTKAAAAPPSNRRFNPADGVYIGGFANGTPDQTIEFTDGGIKLAAKGGHTLESTEAAGWTVDKLTVTGALQLGGQILSQTGAAYTQAITTTGAINGGSVAAGSIGLASHHHTAQGATSPTTPAQP